MILFKPESGTAINVYGAIDDPEGTYTSIGTVDCGAASGRATIRFNLSGYRLYIKHTESGVGTTLTIRGWEVTYKLIGRQP